MILLGGHLTITVKIIDLSVVKRAFIVATRPQCSLQGFLWQLILLYTNEFVLLNGFMMLMVLFYTHGFVYCQVLHETEAALSHTLDEAQVRLFNAANSRKNSTLSNGNHGSRKSSNSTSSKRTENNKPSEGSEHALDKSQNSVHEERNRLQRSVDSISIATSGSCPRQPPKPTPRQSSRDKPAPSLNQSEKLASSHNNQSVDNSNEQYYSETFEKTQSDISEDIVEDIEEDDEDLEVPNNSPYKGNVSDDDSF